MAGKSDDPNLIGSIWAVRSIIALASILIPDNYYWIKVFLTRVPTLLHGV